MIPTLRPCAALTALVLTLALAPSPARSQSLEGVGVVPAGLTMRGMDGVKRVLMIGAHPDDEDTAFLTALARDLGVDAAYLSLTRGDGGQNLIGPELWEGLGVIRTGELEAARRLDGARQYFTRAFDFGYSKTAEEALTFWPHDEILSDVVWVIRTFRPQVIVSVWTGTPRDGHGQHSASGVLARDAYEAAGDPTRFPEQLDRGVEAWAPLKLYQSARRDPDESTVLLEAGRLDPLLGRSTYQLAMASRSQHRSQDMGTSQPMGPRVTGVTLERSRVDAGAGLFAGIDTTLVGLTESLPASVRAPTRGHLEAYRASLARAREAFGWDPAALAAPLLEALAHARMARDAAGDAAGTELANVLDRRIEQAGRAFRSAAGIVVDARAEDDLVVPGQTVRVDVTLWNGGGTPLGGVDAALAIPPGWRGTAVSTDGVGPDGSVAPGGLATWEVDVAVPTDADPSDLYFLRQPRDGALYRWPDEPHLWGLPRDPSPVDGRVAFTASSGGRNVTVETTVPWRYVGVDQARGEYVEPVLVVPMASVGVAPSALVWPADRFEPATVSVTVRSQDPDAVRGTVRLEAPGGWRVSPGSQDVELAGPGAERTVAFQVEPTGNVAPAEYAFRATLTTDRGVQDRTLELIDYEHIERAALISAAESRFTVVPVRIAGGLRVGYVMGTGDDGPEALRQMGADVSLLSPEAVREGDFTGFDALVLGVRAYETRDDVRAANEQILDFARGGGTVVVQYNQYQFAGGGYAPYPVDISRPHDRVSDETADVRILRPDAPVFTGPNRIAPSDFDGWVQERGLYFLGTWDDRYTPLLEMHDPGEEPKRGSLVVAEVGDGLYVYTGLSFFRQWSSRVPGAYRLFANLVSLKASDWRAYEASAGGR